MQIRKLFRENMLLEVYDRAGGVYYKSLLQEVNEDNLAIGVPMKGGERLDLREGSGYLFRLLSEDALFYFRSKVEGREKGDRVPLYLLAWPERVERRQRRGFYRLACTFNIDYWDLDDKPDHEAPAKKQETARREGAGLKIVAPKKWSEMWDKETLALYRRIQAKKPCRAVAINLSGGGLLLVARRSLQPGALLALRFFLQNKGEKKKEILVRGRVARVLPFQIGKIRHYRCGVEFLKINERVRDEIIRFIFFMLRQRLP